MKVRGFGKRYFTLASIQAHSVAPKLLGFSARTHALLLNRYDTARETDEDPPEEAETLTGCLISDTPCHCDCYFKSRTRRTLLHAKLLCFKQCNCRFYSFRRTGTHPPAP